MSSSPSYPAFLAEIVACVGRDAADAIVRAKGGQRVVFPSRAAARQRDNWLSALVGVEKAERIAALFHPPFTAIVPTGEGMDRARRRALALDMLRNGARVNEVAAALRFHHRTVVRLRRSLELEKETPSC